MGEVVKATLEFPSGTYECVWPLKDFNPSRAAAQIGFEARKYAAISEAAKEEEA